MLYMTQDELQKKVILIAREYGIRTALFRHAIASILEINDTDMECMGLMYHKWTSTPSELCELLGLSSGAVTAMLDRLEKRELIQRIANPDDRRGTIIQVNKKTAQTVAPLFDPLRKAQQDLTATYSLKDLSLILDFFNKSIAMWENERDNLKRKHITKLPQPK
jgi:DNA-binding MarR family transcriptional regulator